MNLIEKIVLFLILMSPMIGIGITCMIASVSSPKNRFKKKR